MILILQDAAKAEAEDIADWYSQQQPALGDDFLNEFHQCLRLIRDAPLQFACLEGHPRLRKFRRALVDRFPYLVVYRLKSESVEVLAVIHTSRNLNAWRKRLN